MSDRDLTKGVKCRGQRAMPAKDNGRIDDVGQTDGVKWFRFSDCIQISL